MALNLTQFKADLKASMKAAAESNKELSPNDPAEALDKAMENISAGFSDTAGGGLLVMQIAISAGVMLVSLVVAFAVAKKKS